MKWKDKKISQLILKKSNSYLKLSIILFLLTLMMPIFFEIYMINEQKEQENNYKNNDNVHMIRLDGRLLDKQYYALTNQERNKLETILNKEGYRDDYSVTTLFKIIGTVDKENGNGIEVFGISKKAANWIVDNKLQDNTLYMKNCKEGEVELEVPVITMKEDGVEVNESVDLTLKLEGSVREDSPLLLYMHEFTDLPQAYVTEETCLELLKHMYKIDENINSLYSKEIEDITAIEEVYVYVKDIYQIDDIASVLEGNGYCITYTFEAFDSLSTTLLRSNLILSCLMVLILVISTVNLVFSFWSFLKVQQKDMGILLFFGYSKQRVYSIYRKNINRIFNSIGGIAMVLSTVVWLVFIKNSTINSLLWILLLIVSIVVIISRIVIWGPLRSYVNKDELHLIKKSKEFE